MSDQDQQHHFSVLDYVIFTVMLVLSAGIGIFHGCRRGSAGKKKTAKDFLMASNKMSIVPVAISILLSFMSAILILGTPAEMYTAGTEFYVSLLGMILAVVLATLLFVPLLYPLNLTSSFEYLERRFKSKAAKLTGTLILIVQQILYMGVASYAPSTALEAVTGFPAWATIIIVGLVSTFYTTTGGMKAVVWTDVLQAGFMVAGLLSITIQGVIKVGSVETVWQNNYEWGRINFFNFDPDPGVRHSFWSLVVGSMVSWTAVYGCNQASVQRYSSLPTLNKARLSVLLNIVGLIVLITVTCFAGIVIFAYYVQKGCDPLTDGSIKNSNQIVPYFVMEVLTVPGLPGLFVACLFSGALSTMSSCLNALAAVTWQDFLQPVLGHRMTESGKTWVTRLLVLVYGGAGIGMAFMASGLGGHVLQASLSFTGSATGPVLGLFLLGALFPWANHYGAVVGGVLGLALPLWISIGSYSLNRHVDLLDFPNDSCVSPETTTITSMYPGNFSTTSMYPVNFTSSMSGLDVLYTVSYMWYPSIGAATVVVIGLIVSFITGESLVDEVDPKYLIPLFDRLFCCLPASLRRKLRCDRDFPKPEDIKAEETLEVSAIGDTVPPPPSYDKIYPPKVADTPISTISNGVDATSADQPELRPHFNIFSTQQVLLQAKFWRIRIQCFFSHGCLQISTFHILSEGCCYWSQDGVISSHYELVLKEPLNLKTTHLFQQLLTYDGNHLDSYDQLAESVGTECPSGLCTRVQGDASQTTWTMTF
ncbi:sodium-coupled monocarboxylate transporter 1-like [Babylonia areolata]|uniref:sodium-coupled monocarboxylate transporter 1-like n=1 Tax=Babylonia areolata TaxID=304850 RepID=UPI003FD1CAA9